MFDAFESIFVIAHTDAGDRRTWTDDQDVRPLSALGRAQAEALTEVVGVVDAVISSPARRCVETVEGIAARSGVSTEIDDRLRELTYVDEHRTWERWNPEPEWRARLGASAGVGRVSRCLHDAAERHSGKRLVLCLHGDLAPLFVQLASGYFGVASPPPVQRGGCFEIVPTDASHPVRALGPVLDPPGGP